MMRKLLFIVVVLATAAAHARAAWYWPFDFGSETNKVRLSELMEPATTNIDAAADFAADGKFKEAQECYRAAIAALNKIEQENPERATTPEFATVRNKRAYINAALDSMLLAEARENAKAVAVTDTTGLEMKLALKPWKEFQPIYVALTNADRLVTMRMAVAESALAREILDSIDDARTRAACASNQMEIAKDRPSLEANRRAMQEAYKKTALAVARMEKFSETVSSSGGVRVFDVCKKDVRQGMSACKAARAEFGGALEKTSRDLGGLYGAMMECGAKKNFPEIAKQYVDKISGRTMEDAETLVQDFGHLRACQQMLGELDAAGAGFVNTNGVLYRFYAKWGGEEADVPQEEEDRGLVKNDGDARPEVESQIDAYMEKERKVQTKTKVSAERAKARKDVQREVKKLLKEDPQSRKGRLLQAGEDLRNGDAEAAKEKVKALLDEKPNDGPALNMRAAIEAAEGDLKAAEKTLDQAIRSCPRDYHAYYNMANLFLQKGNVDGARRYYETGRSFAGPKDEELEKAVMRR